MSENGSLKSSRIDGFYDQLLSAIDLEFSKITGHVPIEKWVEKVKLPSGPFTFQNHEYQEAILQEDGIRQVLKKGTQLGISETQILKSIYGLLYGRYPQGVLYLFPTQNDVYDFSRARFGPLLMDNPEIGKEVRETESVTLKRVRKSMLYLRGARASSRIEGVKAMATQLLAIPVDRIVFDERDNMADNMIDLALERLGHSSVKEEVYLGTPSIPDYGVDHLYNDSDQRVLEIKCSHCNTGTVLELEFPNCLLELSDGRVIRGCKKCKKEIFPKDGLWVTQYPGRSKDLVGWWISRLNSAYADLKKILRTFQDPSNRNLAEFYNSTLAMAYIAAENRLTVNNVYSCCGQDAMSMNHKGPCGMGVDVGSLLNVVVGFKPKDKQLQVCYLARVSSFNDVHDIAQRFNMKYAVIDMEPELRKAREFQASEPYPVFLCDYQDRIVSGPQWDEEKKIVKAQRTELCDTTHELMASSGPLILPRRSEEVEVFAKQCANTAKVLQEDPETGSREYRYRKLGEDHYRHALNYFYLASKRIGVVESVQDAMKRRLLEMAGDEAGDKYNPLTFGLVSRTGTGYDPFRF
jgi:hypothetical protein